MVEIATNASFCGDRTNVGMGSRYPVQAIAFITLDGVLAAFLGIIDYKGKTIAVVGTNDGRIVKVGVSPLPTFTQKAAREI